MSSQFLSNGYWVGADVALIIYLIIFEPRLGSGVERVHCCQKKI